MNSVRNLFIRSRRRNLAIGSLAIAVAGVSIVGAPGSGDPKDVATSTEATEAGCHAGVVPAAALPQQPGPVLCADLGAGPGTAVDGVNDWFDDFDHGLSFASFEDAGYATSVVGDPGRTAFWRHADHWMVDIAPEGAGTAGAFVRPDRSFRFDDALVVETVTTAGHADYGAHAWPEIVVTTGAEPTGRRPDGLYAYDHFSGHTTLGCRLQAERVPVCSLFNNTTNGVDGGRLWEISFFQQAGDVTFGGGPWVDDSAWRTCDADNDPDSACRDRFRLELTPDSLTLTVNGVRYFAQSGLPEMPTDFADGDLYVYAASMLWRNPDDVVRFHWDDLIVNGGDTTAPPPTAAPSTTTAATTTAATTTADAPTTTSTAPPAPTTTTSTTTTTTTSTTTTAVPTTTSTTAAPTTTAPPAVGSAFIEEFTGNTGLERFDTGVYHRDDHLVANESWSGDHDLDCGSPDTQRTIHRDRPDESFYLCRDHLMTSVGDTSGYSIGWFSPKQTFERRTHTAVSWEVNVTDLGGRQWWEVILVPEGEPFLATIDWLAGTADIDAYGPNTIAVGIGPFAGDDNIVSGGEVHHPLGWRNVGDADPEARASKAIRRPFRMLDNLDGTITFEYLGETITYPGRFPERFRVYFKDHNYTPDKDGIPVGHTWHWDTIAIR